MSVSVTENVDAPRPLLFQPFRIRDLTLKNRLVVPPMVHYRAGPGGTCGIFHNVHLGRYALGGFGMVFVEATGVEEIGLINEHDLGIWNDAQVQSFKPLIAFMKGENTAIGIQLAHGGRKSSSQRAMDGMGPLTPEQIKAGAKVWQPVGPTSEPVADGWLTPRQLTAEECRAMVGTWARAARNAVAAGFDAIEIHTAHGYLLASFSRPFPTRAMTNMAAISGGACACRSKSSKRCGARCRTACRCSCASPRSTGARTAGTWMTRWSLPGS
jgi:2,4-dienoyl-CoA reductase-like NADH-dependent reductase (Old Yellow Enzyme family)